MVIGPLSDRRSLSFCRHPKTGFSTAGRGEQLHPALNLFDYGSRGQKTKGHIGGSLARLCTLIASVHES